MTLKMFWRENIKILRLKSFMYGDKRWQYTQTLDRKVYLAIIILIMITTKTQLLSCNDLIVIIFRCTLREYKKKNPFSVWHRKFIFSNNNTRIQNGLFWDCQLSNIRHLKCQAETKNYLCYYWYLHDILLCQWF